MSSDIILQIQRALAATGTIVDTMCPDDWDSPSPCDGWSARDVANHLVGGMNTFAELLGGASAQDDLERDWLGTDPAASYRAAAAADSAAWSRAGSLDGQVALSFATLPAPMAAVIHLTELVVHGLDLAVATRRTNAVDETIMAELLDLMASMGGIDAFRGPGFFGPELPTEPGAAPHRRLLAYVGRELPEPQAAKPVPSFAPDALRELGC